MQTLSEWREGRSVIVLDDWRIGGGMTERTTAHLSNAVDDRYFEIERIHGEKGARLAARSHTAAIDRIEAIVAEEGIDCDFERLDGNLFVPPGDSKEGQEVLMQKQILQSEFPGQRQDRPGLEYKMRPEPEIIRPNYRGSEKLAGKVALVTGGDSGIGRAVAVHFAREGADVAIIYLNVEEKDADMTKKLVEKEGKTCLLLPGDIRDRTFCASAIKRTLEKFGRLNILVNNAAEQHPVEDIRKLDLDIMERTFQTNIFAMFYLSKEALKHMKEGDCIINSTSVTNYRGSPELLDYSSTKGAITAFTRSLGKNLAKKGIRVNGVAPGPIWTPLIPSTFKGEKVREFGRNTPMGRAGQPSEVAPAYVFLASDDASYITSQIIHPNGGEVVNA